MTNILMEKKDQKNILMESKTKGMELVKGLPPMKEAERPSMPDIQEGTYVNTPQFKEMFQRGIRDPEALTSEERRQFDAAIESFSELRQFAEQGQKEATESSIHPDLQPIAESFLKLGQTLTANVGSVPNPELGRAMLDVGLKTVDLSKKAFGEFFGNIIGVEKLTGKKVSEHVAGTFDDIGFAPIAKDDPRAAWYVPDAEGNNVEFRMPEASRVATNLTINAIRFLPELLTSAVEDPGGFQIMVAEFPFQEANIILEAATGSSVQIEDGKLKRKLISDEEVENAIEEIKQNPLGVVLLGLMAVGVGGKAFKKNKITVAKERMQRFYDDFEKAKEEIAKAKAEKTIAKEKAEAVRAEKKAAKPTVPSEGLGEVERIKSTAEGQLRSELLDMQEGAKEPLKPIDIAKMSRNEIEHKVSAGKIALEKVEKPTKAVKLEPNLKKEGFEPPKVKPKQEEIKVEEKPAEKPKVEKPVVEPITPEELAKAEKDVKTLKDDITSRTDRIESQIKPALEGVESKADKKNLQAWLHTEEANLAKAKTQLVETESILEDFQKRPVKEAEKPKEPVEKKVVEPEKKVEEPTKPPEKTLTELEPEKNPEVKPIPKVAKTADKEVELRADIEKNQKLIPLLEQSIAEKLPPEQKRIYQDQINEAKENINKNEAEIAKLQDGKEIEAAELADKPPDKLPEKEVVSKVVIDVVPLEKLKVDPKRFQNRTKPFHEGKASEVDKNYDRDRLNRNPLLVWKDPKDGELYVISGHSRKEGLTRRQARVGDVEGAPVTYFKGTEKEAILEARLRANRDVNQETLAEDVEAYRLARDEGYSKEKLNNLFPGKLGWLEAYSHLNPKGKLMDIIDQGLFDDFPHAKRWGRNIGELRKAFPKLTNTHEKQIFDQLYPNDRATGLYDKINKERLFSLVDKQVSDIEWTPNLPIRLTKESKPMVGVRARQDTGPILKEIDRLEELMKENARKIENPEAIQKANSAIQSQIDKLEEGIKEVLKKQGTFLDVIDGTSDGSVELGIFGTPQAYSAAIQTVYKGIKGASEFSNDILNRAKVSPKTQEGVRTALVTMTEHHRELRDVDIMAGMLDKAFAETIKDKSRWRTIANAAEQGPKSSWYKELNNFEKGIVEWISLESKKLEDFVRKKDIMELPEREEGMSYIYHWVVDPKTKKPYLPNYGKFARSGPQFKQRKFKTIEELEKAGFETVTYNPGRLIGEAWKSVMRAHQTKEMVKNLNAIESPDVINFTDKKGENPRPAGMIEPWSEIKNNGVENLYTKLRDERDILAKKIFLPTKTGAGRIIEAPVGVLNELHPFVQSYIENPTYGKAARIVFIAKGAKLFGMFHPAVLFKQSITMGRNPVFDLIRGKRLLEQMDETTVLLRRNGLNISGFEDIGFNTKEAIKIGGESLPAKIGNAITSPLWGTQHLIFEVIHPRLKLAFAYNTFLKEWPRLKKEGLTKDEAAREVVRMADELFSGEDYKTALLESSRFAAKYYYSAAYRKAWQMGILSPTWQVEHLRMFNNVVKASMPKKIQVKIKEITPNNFQVQRKWHTSPIANTYRRYLAGAVTMYAGYQMLNWVITKSLDGEGKFIFQNEEGKRMAHVRAPWNNPDGSKAFFYPIKSIMEVPSATGALIDGDFSKFLSKLNPIVSSTARQLLNVDSFGNKLYEERNKSNMAKRFVDWNIDVWEPITISNIVDAHKRHKLPIGSIVSAFSFPISKGYPGGEWSKKITDFRLELKGDRAEQMKQIDNAIIDGNIAGALQGMLDLGMSKRGMANRLLKHQDRLLYNWENLSKMQQFMFLDNLSKEEADDFFETLGGSE